MDSGNGRMHLLVGLGDGTLYQALLDAGSGDTLESRTTELGQKGVMLGHCRTKTGWGAFACGNRATVVYYERGRARHSPLSLKGITGTCSVNFEHYTNCMAFSTTSGIIIGRIRDVQKLHILTVLLGHDCPQRISHHPGYGVLGVGSTRTEPHKVDEVLSVTSHFIIFDDSTLQRLSTFTCKPTEEVYSISTLSLFDGLENRTCFALGTVFMKPSEVESSKGRIMIFNVVPSSRIVGVQTRSGAGGEDKSKGTGSRGSWLLTSDDVDGCVYSISLAEGLLLVAVNSVVYLYRLERTSPNRPYTLAKLSVINHNYQIPSISTSGTNIFVADSFNSVSLFKLVGNGAKMNIIAKCYTPNWAVTLNEIGEKGCIGADGNGNLFTYRIGDNDEKTFLEREGFYHLGEQVNRFLAGTLARYSTDDHLQAQPNQLFFTSVGRIGVISEFNDQLSFSMTELQRNLNAVIKGPGDITLVERRRPTKHTDAQPQAVGFLDGDYLEQYLSQEGRQLVWIQKGGNDAETLRMGHQEIVQVLEKLQSIH